MGMKDHEHEKPRNHINAGPNVSQGEIEGESEFINRISEAMRDNLVEFVVRNEIPRHLAERGIFDFRILRKPYGFNFEIPMYFNGYTHVGMLHGDDEMMEYSRPRGISDPQDRVLNKWLVFKGTNLRDLIETYNTGFMRRNAPDLCVDVEAIARECNFDLDKAVHR